MLYKTSIDNAYLAFYSIALPAYITDLAERGPYAPTVPTINNTPLGATHCNVYTI